MTFQLNKMIIWKLKTAQMLAGKPAQSCAHAWQQHHHPSGPVVVAFGIVWGEDDLGRVDLKPRPASLAKVGLDDVWCGADHVLALLILDKIEMLQRGDDVVSLEGRQVGQLLDTDGTLTILEKL